MEHNFKTPSEEATYNLLINFELECIKTNYIQKNPQKNDDGEIDGIFYDRHNQLYLIYDDSTGADRQDKVAKFLNKWKDSGNKAKLVQDLGLKDYPIYILYFDKSGNDKKIESLDYAIDDYTKIIYTADYLYFEEMNKIVGKWGINDFYNFLNIKPRVLKKQQTTAIQIWVGNTPAYLFADRVENILKYSFICRRKDNPGGYQRMIDEKRVKGIAANIKNKKINAFPNSILLNCVEDINSPPIDRTKCPAEVKIDLPNGFSSCKVVDGQHRLLAFSRLEPVLQDSHSLPIVLFQQMPIEQEIQTFIEINNTQKRIDPNLIFSLKADLKFQVGTKEYREKVCVEISKKLNTDAPLFKENVFMGSAGEKRGKKITLTTIVGAMLDFRIVDTIKGFLQSDEVDIEGPYLIIKEYVQLLLQNDVTHIQFYKSNNGVKLILKLSSLIEQNIKKSTITITREETVKEFIKSIKINQLGLVSKYGKGGFNTLSNLIFNDMKKSSIKLSSFELDMKKLK